MPRFSTPLAAAILTSCVIAYPLVAEQPPLVTGQVLKVDESANKVTIRHGPIKNLDMNEPSMTMVFAVKDPGLLKAVKPGDRIKFAAERVDGVITVTKVQR